MTSVVRFFHLTFLPSQIDAGLLVLRLWLGGSMLVLHGWGKLAQFSSLASSFQDPLGVGSRWSLILAICGEVLCPLLLILGFVARLAALGAATTMAVAWYMIHNMALSGRESGELAFVYLAGFVVLFLTGPGRFSLDGAASRGSTSRIKPQAPRK